ncbi:daunorubicin resistance protein DrrA family ABC transporter ATP-binding protein [Streptomyces rubellomurinus]|uniref:ABC-type xenobiotic transporter n=1 Tax=Streptomyces rubellomurinus (strain ATCC 31215) TaxID=359131 RepID=A0A0F2TEZ6_STRR3|nr:daunorubicin resistance protein DrrA family ABC transporter ATP-binding protein [Streptomyces rubellomurinus]KJS61709.1 ABC transporter [Streptomyces rubellomurinus]
MEYAIQVEDLTKRFSDTQALAGVDFTVRPGTVLGLLGPNGSGKTTTVRILATLLKADSGRARICGYDVATEAHEVRSLLGVTGQYAAVDEKLTGMHNLVLVGRLLGLSKSAARRRSDELLERFGLTDSAGKLAGSYSGGMRRRLDLAASLVGQPSVLCLDEPTTGLDPRSRSAVWETVRGLVADGLTVLLTTQYLEEADQLADDLVVIDHGKVIAQGTADQLKAKVGGQTVEVRPADPQLLDDTLRLVTEVIGNGAPSVEGGLITAATQDPSVLPALVRRLDDAGIAVTGLALRQASLDEVFLTLTGGSDEEKRTVA